MPTASIFDEKNKVQGKFFSFKEIGDNVQGTYVGKRETINKLTGKNQWIYELIDEEGQTVLIGGKPGIDVNMRNIREGQIVGFKFVEERENKTKGLDATKIIEVYANRDVVDEKWLKERESSSQEITVENIPSADSVAAPSKGVIEDTAALFEPTVKEKFEKIKKLAILKLGIKDEKEVIGKVMEATEIAFLEGNYSDIIAKLESMK